MNYSKKEIEKLLDGIYAGDISEYNIPESLYFSIADYLKSGLYKGFGGDLTDFKGKDLELLQELRENTYMFSAAKSFQEVKQIGSLMFNEDGDLRSSREFSALGAAEFDKWNKDWGLTERNTAIAQAKMAGKWNEIQENKDLLPYLTYSTIGDACDICAPLDGLTAKVDDPIWNSVMPVNHFNCECVVLQGEDTGTLTPEREKEAIYDTVTGEMSDTFKMNPGKDGYIFSPDHPYFEVAPKDQAFAKTNFGLPIPTVEEELGNKIYKEIYNTEDEIRNNDFETAAIFDSEGDPIIRIKGSKDSVSIPHADIPKLKDSIFTHNHPLEKGEPLNGIGRATFSSADFRVAIIGDVAEMRAVSTDYIFSIKKPEKGWPSLSLFSITYKKTSLEVSNLMRKRVLDGTTTNNKAKVVYHNLINKKVCEKLGIEYIKTKIK